MPSDPNTQLAISKIDRAIYLLVNSFGHKSQVIEHLQAARGMLGEREVTTTPVPGPGIVVIDGELSTSSEADAVVEEAAASAPRKQIIQKAGTPGSKPKGRSVKRVNK